MSKSNKDNFFLEKSFLDSSANLVSNMFKTYFFNKYKKLKMMPLYRLHLDVTNRSFINQYIYEYISIGNDDYFGKIMSVQPTWHLTFSKYMAGVQQMLTFMDDTTVWDTDGCQKFDLDEIIQL